MCCLPIAGSEQLNDKAADQPQALQTGSRGKKALRGKGVGDCAEWPGPTPGAPNHGEQKLNLSARGSPGSGRPWAAHMRRGCAPGGPTEASTSQEGPIPSQRRSSGLVSGQGSFALPKCQCCGQPPKRPEERCLLSCGWQSQQPPHMWGLPDPPEPWPTSALEFYPRI